MSVDVFAEFCVTVLPLVSDQVTLTHVRVACVAFLHSSLILFSTI